MPGLVDGLAVGFVVGLVVGLVLELPVMRCEMNLYCVNEFIADLFPNPSDG